MSKRPIPAVAADFKEVLSFLQQKAIVGANPSTDVLSTAKRIHGYTYSMILWRFRLRGLPEHSKVFVEEIASDALQVLPQVLMGYSKTAKLLIRGILENALRHIYFSDHPVEYARMNREKKWFLTIQDLCDYAKNHPHFLKTEHDFDAINQLASLHSDLSSGVHGRTVRDLEMRAALKKIVYEEAAAKEEADAMRKCTEASNFLLGIFHIEKMRIFSAEDRRIILRSIPAQARAVWHDWE